MAIGAILIAASPILMVAAILPEERDVDATVPPILPIICWWLLNSGEFVVAIGGVGAIHWAVTVRRRK
jgi:hypothetical protein